MLRYRLRWLWQQLVPPSGKDERNAYFLYVEIVFASVLSAAASFNATYILRLGGSNALVGLLSSLPALIAMLLYIPSAGFLERRERLMPWLIGSLSVARLGYLLIPLLPLVLVAGVPEITVALMVATTAPTVFFSTAWSPLLSDIIPARSRATVLAGRSILSSATIAIMIFLAGRWLDSTPFPSNYRWMYLVGFAAAAISTLLVSRIMPPETKPAAKLARQKLPWRDLLGISLLRDNPLFGRIVTNTLLFNLGAWMVAPLYTILFVRQMGASDGWIGLNGTLAHIGVVTGYWLWRKVIRRIGEQKALLLAMPLNCIYPFLVTAWPNLTFILFAGFLINAIAPGVNLSHSVIFLELLPENKKMVSTAIYSTAMNIGAFVAPLIGVAISEWIGIVPTLVIGGVLRIVGASLFYWRPLQRPAPAENLA